MVDKLNSNIFIASSHEARGLAGKLASAIIRYTDNFGDEHKFKLVPLLWWASLPTNYILNTVRDEMKKCDFAAVLLTARGLDVSQKQIVEQAGPTTLGDKRILHYNPIFEAGLFIGDVDKHERCFLVTSCGKEELFSDIDGLIHIRISDDQDSINKAARLIYEKAETMFTEEELRAVRGLKRTIYSMDELYDREQLKAKGGKLETSGAVVFVNTPEPLEWHQAKFSYRVVDNILDDDMNYTYIFLRDYDKKMMGNGIVSLIKAVKEKAKTNKLFRRNIGVMARNLNIYFSSFYGGLQFCIHDAKSEIRAKCYMRCRHQGVKQDFWIDFVETDQAAKFVRLIELIKAHDENTIRRIFHNTSEVKILEDEFRVLTKPGKELKESIEDAMEKLPGDSKFSPKDTDDIMKACFYGMDK